MTAFGGCPRGLLELAVGAFSWSQLRAPACSSLDSAESSWETIILLIELELKLLKQARLSSLQGTGLAPIWLDTIELN